jgi:hypothetical protein
VRFRTVGPWSELPSQRRSIDPAALRDMRGPPRRPQDDYVYSEEYSDDEIRRQYEERFGGGPRN